MSESLVRAVRDPSAGAEGSPQLVLLHGLGSDEQDLLALAPQLDPRLRVISLRAPFRYNLGGYAWFPLEWRGDGIFVDPSHVVESLERLVAEIEQIRAQGGKLLLGGFSQGAMMSLGVALRRPDLLDGVLLLSGRGVPELFQSASPEVRRVPFLVQHGLYDSVLDVAGTREVRDSLVELGAEVEYHEYQMAHEVSFASLRDADAWLRRQLA